MSNTKLLARNPVTGLYFNGTNFSEPDAAKALELRPGTTSESWNLIWANPVEVVKVEIAPRSFAERIAAGEIDRHTAAREYVVARQRVGQKSFSVRVSSGTYISRVVHVEKSGGPRRVAWIKYNRNENSLIWSQGELALDI